MEGGRGSQQRQVVQVDGRAVGEAKGWDSKNEVAVDKEPGGYSICLVSLSPTCPSIPPSLPPCFSKPNHPPLPLHFCLSLSLPSRKFLRLSVTPPHPSSPLQLRVDLQPVHCL